MSEPISEMNNVNDVESALGSIDVNDHGKFCAGMVFGNQSRLTDADDLQQLPDQ